MLKLKLFIDIHQSYKHLYSFSTFLRQSKLYLKHRTSLITYISTIKPFELLYAIVKIRRDFYFFQYVTGRS